MATSEAAEGRGQCATRAGACKDPGRTCCKLSRGLGGQT